MGFFGFFASADEKRKEEVRTGARAPDRNERKRCWDARDNFYRCLDRHDVIDSLNGDGRKKADKQCAEENRAFEHDCAAAWVTYFKKSRVAEYQKKKAFERLDREGANKVATLETSDAPTGVAAR